MPNPKLETYKNKATNTVYDLTDAAAQATLEGILDGTDIDSFGDVETALATKVDKVAGKGLSTNDYDDTEKAKVVGAFPRSEQAVLGAKNLLPINVTSGTSNGITWVVNSDKTVTVYGTATARVDIALIPTKAELLKDFLPYLGKTLIINGCPSGGTVATGYWMLAQGLETDGIGANDVGNGASFTVNDFTNYQTVGIRISVANGVNMGTETNPKVFKPMIRLATDTDSTYVPYAMTNEELTNKVAITDYETVSNSGLIFVFYRSGNVVTVNMSGESTSAFANDADIVTIPEKYRFYKADNINIISYEMVNSRVKLLLLSGSKIKANTPIAVGDKLRGSFSYITS